MIIIKIAVSIIIPMYNTELYIEECLQSCINQTYKNFEIIIIDDKSTDKSVDIAKDILEKSKCKYRIIEKERRLGVSNSRNIGIKYAEGDYIYFLDSDDIIKSNTLEVLLRVAQNKGYKVVFGRYDRSKESIYLNNKVEDEYTIYDISYDELGELLWAGVIWGGLIYTEIIKNNNINFDEALEYGEDTIFKIELFNYIDKLVMVDEILYFWRIVEKSLSYNFNPLDNIRRNYDMLNALNCRLNKYVNPKYIAIIIRMIRMKKNSIYDEVFNLKNNEFDVKKVESIKIPSNIIIKSNLSYKYKVIELALSLLSFLDNYSIWKILK